MSYQYTTILLVTTFIGKFAGFLAVFKILHWPRACQLRTLQALSPQVHYLGMILVPKELDPGILVLFVISWSVDICTLKEGQSCVCGTMCRRGTDHNNIRHLIRILSKMIPIPCGLRWLQTQSFSTVSLNSMDCLTQSVGSTLTIIYKWMGSAIHIIKCG